MLTIDFCTIVCGLLDADQVLVAREVKNKLHVVASTDVVPDELPETWIVEIPQWERFRFAQDVQTNAEFASHPVRQHVPVVQQLLAARLTDRHDTPFFMLALEPATSAVTNRAIIRSINTMANLIDSVANQFSRAPQSGEDRDGFREPQNAFVTSKAGETEHPRNNNHVDPLSDFLADTLIKKFTVRSRGGQMYYGTHTWRKQIKAHQVAAMKAIKRKPSESMVTVAASEIAALANIVAGKNVIRQVVAIPCGNSGRKECLSTRLARRVAKLLDASYTPIIEETGNKPARPGSSHPAKSARLKPYTLTSKPQGAVLLVDDVSTSGRHMELASKALRDCGVPVFAIAWIVD
jgi:pyrimidine operon attenuation protein/uracil phosphoribosyltransferase